MAATKIKISGQVRNATGMPIPNASVTLIGRKRAMHATDVNGNYSFEDLPLGSYRVEADVRGCSFFPDDVELHNLTKSAVQNFDGSGAGCGGKAVARLTISGVAIDAHGLPLAGVKVLLSDRQRDHETTATDGKFAFTHLIPASYDVKPELPGCVFSPRRADVDNLTDDTFLTFSGSGPGCGGDPAVNGGAMAGPLTISGHVRDPSGNPVVGARIDLGGADTALRFSDWTGAFAFNVQRGTYTLRASGACNISPSNVRRIVSADVSQDFVASGTACITAPQTGMTSTGSVLTLQSNGIQLGSTYAHLEARADSADALARLQEIADERIEPSRHLTIGGFPAIERQVVVPLQTGIDPEFFGDSAGSLAAAQEPPPTTITTAIALGDRVIRFEGFLPHSATQVTIDAFFLAGRNFDSSTQESIHGGAPATLPLAPDIPPAVPPPVTVSLTAPNSVTFNEGEIEIAASDSANAVIYGTQNAVFRSTDNGVTINPSTINFATPVTAPFLSLFGDPTVAVGAPNLLGRQAFWYLQIELSSVTPPPARNQLSALGLYKSTDNGANFNAATTAFPIDCTTQGCAVPDQPHIAADRVHQATVKGLRFDQLYAVWRNFTGPTTKVGLGVACSSDEQNWTRDVTTIAAAAADFGRLTVAPDGSLLVAYRIASGAGYRLMVQKFKKCSDGFAPQFVDGPSRVPAPNAVMSVNEVADLPGLDRPPTGNYAIAADTSDATGQRIFVTYANEPGVGRDDVHVAESTDGGKTWPQDVVVNTSAVGNRFFPWICTTNGTAFVSWYDRRNATAASPDLTAYYRSSVSDTGGALQVGAEVNVSGVDDPECRSGFPGGTRSAVEENSCGGSLPGSAANPVLAGTCCPAGTNPVGGTCCAAGAVPPCGMAAPLCDFRFGCPPAVPPAPATVCVAGDPTFSGDPKYGDYNGNGCAHGILYMAWASATAPTAFGCTLLGLGCMIGANCCSGNCLGGTCAPAAAAVACVANGGVCAAAGQCCTGRCQGGQCLPTVAVFEATSALVSCTTAAPDQNEVAPFDIDTGLAGGVGANYGNGTCDKFLAELDLTAAGLHGHDLFVGGGWSSTLPANPCDEQATMDVFVFDGSLWRLLDEVTYTPSLQAGLCRATASSHTDPGSQGLGGTKIPAAANFQKARVAVRATENGNKVPVLMFVQQI